ncbi:MAG TPA: antibiotic biosynthesis monooxygenase [Terriglobales bacterium]|jgi:heme-degrading monooxygenase HmoA|nr:antibiotic biosynthesis monooxygenase [Terriglobales bacterium]
MFVRVVEVKTKPGKAREACDTLHEKVLSTLKAQAGFVDEIVLVSDQEGILALSFWKTRDDAERYNRDDYDRVNKLIQHLVHTKPKVHAFDLETSTCHHIAKGKEA